MDRFVLVKSSTNTLLGVKDSFNGGVVFQGAETGVVSLHGLLHGASIFPIANLVSTGKIPSNWCFMCKSVEEMQIFSCCILWYFGAVQVMHVFF